MARGDKRKSLKTRRRVGQVKKKARLARKAALTKEARKTRKSAAPKTAAPKVAKA